jgi:hypothetical protein
VLDYFFTSPKERKIRHNLYLVEIFRHIFNFFTAQYCAAAHSLRITGLNESIILCRNDFPTWIIFSSSIFNKTTQLLIFPLNSLQVPTVEVFNVEIQESAKEWILALQGLQNRILFWMLTSFALTNEAILYLKGSIAFQIRLLVVLRSEILDFRVNSNFP